MIRRRSKSFMTVGSMLLLAGAAPAPDGDLVDWSGYGGQLADLVGGQIGRKVTIGSIEVGTSLPPMLRLRDVTIGNAPWGKADDFAEIAELRVQARISDLLAGNVVIPEFAVRGLRLNLERSADGQGNWSFGGSGGSAVTELPVTPVIEKLSVSDARFAYADLASGLDLTARLASLSGSATAEDGVSLSGDGRLAGEPLRISFHGAPLDQLDAADQPYPIRLEVGLRDTKFTADGSIAQPLALSGAEIDLSLAGPDLATLGLGIFPVPETPPYSVQGHLRDQDQTYRFEDAEVEIGETRARGWAEADLGGQTPQVRADLLVPHLRYADLVPRSGTEQAPAQQSGRLFPDEPLPTSWLHQAEGVVHVRVEENDLPGVPVDHVDVRLTLRDGRLEANPLEVGLAGGKVTGEAALNGRTATPSADLDLAFEGLKLKDAARGTRFADETSGTAHGNLYLLGTGASVHDLMATLRGHVSLVVSDGSVSGLLVEAAGLDVAEALVLYVGDDAPVGINCAVAGATVDQGVADIRRLVLGTTDSVIRGDGTVDLGAERLDLRLEAQGKDFSLLDLDAPVFVQGPLTKPGVSVGKTALIPLIDLGLQGDAPCQRLEQEVLSLGKSDESN